MQSGNVRFEQIAHDSWRSNQIRDDPLLKQDLALYHLFQYTPPLAAQWLVMALMFRQGTDPSTSRTLPPAAPLSFGVVVLVTGMRKSRPWCAAPPMQCGAMTHEPSAQALRSAASERLGSSVSFCGDSQ